MRGSRRIGARRRGARVAVAVVALLLPATFAQAGVHPPRDSTGEDPRGMEYRGLERGSSGRCAGAYEVKGTEGCSHGPDPAPPGRDVRNEPNTAQLEQRAATADVSSAAGGVYCDGDGTSGNRVEAIYARASDHADRYSQVVDSLRSYAVAADAVLSRSAAQTGGTRHFRWVTDSTCLLTVRNVVLSPTGDDTLSNTTAELDNKGFNRGDRKYLVWVDAAVYCGIAYIWYDDQPGQGNANNGGNLSLSRVDTNCWGLGSESVEAHELMHNLGGIQQSAPHATPYSHCTDEWDLMCYDDDGAGPVTMTYVCLDSETNTYDCNKDDYFNTNPQPNSYLANYWNTANNSFLMTSTPAPAIASLSPSVGPAGTQVTVNGSGFTGATSVTFNGAAANYVVLSDGRITTTVPSGASTGPVAVTTPEGTATSATAFSVSVAPTVKVTVPVGGESWKRGTTHVLRWTYGGPAGSNVQIDLLRNGALVNTIAANAPIGTNGSGAYSWKIGAKRKLGGGYRIRVRSKTAPSATSTSNTFSIAA